MPAPRSAPTVRPDAEGPTPAGVMFPRDEEQRLALRMPKWEAFAHPRRGRSGGGAPRYPQGV